MSSREPRPNVREPQRRWMHAAFGVGSKHFLWGGEGSSAIRTAQIETFDVSSAKWQEPLLLKGSPPGSLDGMAVTTDGDSAYSFGGWDGSTHTNSIYEINTRTLECRHVLPTSSYSPPGVAHSSILLYNKQLVAFGGDTDKGPTNDLYIFDLRKGECGNSKLYSCLVSCARDERHLESATPTTRQPHGLALVMYAEDSARYTHWKLSAAILDLHRGEQTSAQLLVSPQQVVTTYHPYLSSPSLVNQTIGKHGLAKLTRFLFPLGMLSRVNNWQ